MAFDMHVEAIATAVRHAAESALVAASHHMFPLMLHQQSVIGKNFVTVNTFKRIFTLTVRRKMFLQSFFIKERFVTVITNINVWIICKSFVSAVNVTV